MIIHFTYTECRSPGPFKSESGFKVKSAVVPEVFSSHRDQSIVSQKLLIERAVSNLAPYNPPDINPLVPRQEFDAHPKSWIYTELAAFEDQEVGDSQKGLRSFLFARMFTSGYAGGRARNPFHEGYIFSAKDWKTFSDLCNSFTFPLRARPVDLVDSIGWQNPRGDVELEANVLRQSDIFEIHSFEERLDSKIRGVVFSDLESASWNLARFFDSLSDPSGFGLDFSDESEYYDWVALLSHLVPSRVAWQMSFSDSWRVAKSNSLGANSWRFLRGPTDHEIPSSESQQLASLVISCFVLGVEVELFALLDWLGDRFYVGRQQISAGLSLIPLAYLLLDETLLPDESKQEDWGVLDLLQTLTPPAKWEHPSFKQELLDRISGSKANRLNQRQSQTLEMWLSTVPV